MNINITSEDKGNYLLIESKGYVGNKEELFEQSELMYAEILKYDHKKILLLEQDMHFPKGLFSYFDLVHHYIATFPPEVKLYKIACVVAPEYIEFGKFWETTCVNRGFQYYAFTSADEALKWLLN